MWTILIKDIFNDSRIILYRNMELTEIYREKTSLRRITALVLSLNEQLLYLFLKWFSRQNIESVIYKPRSKDYQLVFKS